jgi:Fe-S-cluster containining protein
MASSDDHQSAGPFGEWLDRMRLVLRDEGDSDVPCGTCAACCSSSQFIHIAPDETDALAHIPSELLFPAPRMPAGHVLMGYDEHGRCPMLIDGACSVYAHRPRTCRVYDCRVFPATGLEPDEPDKHAIAVQVRRWRFEYPTDRDRATHEELVRAAHVVTATHPAAGATQRAVMTVRSD